MTTFVFGNFDGNGEKICRGIWASGRLEAPSSLAPWQTVKMPDSTAAPPAVTQAMADYYKAFSTLDVEAILPYFEQPALLVVPQGVYAMSDAATQTAVFTRTIDDLRARGYGRSELEIEQATPLGPSAALVTGVAVRYKADGQVLERVKLTYLLHNAQGRWKIAVMVVHDAPARPE